MVAQTTRVLLIRISNSSDTARSEIETDRARFKFCRNPFVCICSYQVWLDLSYKESLSYVNICFLSYIQWSNIHWSVSCHRYLLCVLRISLTLHHCWGKYIWKSWMFSTYFPVGLQIYCFESSLLHNLWRPFWKNRIKVGRIWCSENNVFKVSLIHCSLKKR